MRQPSRLIRDYRSADLDPVVELSLRSWAPVYRSLEQHLGPDLCVELHGEWREHQADVVRRVLADADRAWVALADDRHVGFVAAALHPERGLGEVVLIAVDPCHQRRGVGTALTGLATDWLQRSGARVAMVETGGDPGHAPARRLYERAGYVPLPVSRYFKSL
jgi:GNAT superfamily N-acetyltransferase